MKTEYELFSIYSSDYYNGNMAYKMEPGTTPRKVEALRNDALSLCNSITSRGGSVITISDNLCVNGTLSVWWQEEDF